MTVFAQLLNAMRDVGRATGLLSDATWVRTVRSDDDARADRLGDVPAITSRMVEFSKEVERKTSTLL